MGTTLAQGGIVGGRYRLDRELGMGGMGVVWSAIQQPTGQPVALKFLRQQADAMARERLLVEAQTICKLKSPGVVRVMDVIELDHDMPVIVMELLEGEPLGARLEREGPIPLGELCDALRTIVAVLRAAREIGVVHRDLTPNNIFLAQTPDGAMAKLLDFGIARSPRAAHENASRFQTTTGIILGTEPYMSPEQAFADRDIDWRSDVWALGMVMYHCLSGVLPTRGDNAGQTLRLVTQGPIPPLAAVAGDLHRDVTSLVGRMLSLERSERPDLSEIDDVLERHGTAGGAPIKGWVTPCSFSARVIDEQGLVHKNVALAGLLAGLVTLAVLAVVPTAWGGYDAYLRNANNSLLGAPLAGMCGASVVWRINKRLRRGLSTSERVVTNASVLIAGGAIMLAAHVLSTRDGLRPVPNIAWVALSVSGAFAACALANLFHHGVATSRSAFAVGAVVTAYGALGYGLVALLTSNGAIVKFASRPAQGGAMMGGLTFVYAASTLLLARVLGKALPGDVASRAHTSKASRLGRA